MKSLRIALLACHKHIHRYQADPAYLYRLDNLARSLRHAGHQVELSHASQFQLPARHQRSKYAAVLWHRPRYHARLHYQVFQLRRAGTLCLADFDDLVCHPRWAVHSPGVLNQQVPLARTRRMFRSHYRALRLFRHFTVSTQPLQDRIQELTGHVPLWLPNTVHHSWQTLRPRRSAQPCVTYFPGTRSHDRDFATIKAPLEQFLHEQPEVQLRLTGQLSTRILAWPGQVIRQPKQPFQDYAREVARSHLNLSPLEPTYFNRHKSALKVIEAAWFGTPTLASPIPDVQRFRPPVVQLAADQESWYQGLHQVLSPSPQAWRQQFWQEHPSDAPARSLVDYVTQAGARV